MKFVYIGDTFLQSVPFSNSLRSRLFSFCETMNVSHILISGHGGKHFEQSFYETCQKAEIKVIHSPNDVYMEPYKGVLNDTSLFIEDVDTFYPSNGSIIYGNSELHHFQRIYLDIFLAHDNEIGIGQLEEELSELLRDILNQHKKSNQYH